MGTIKVEEIWHQVSCKSRPRVDQIVSKNLKKSWVPLKCKTTKFSCCCDDLFIIFVTKI